MPGKYIHKPQGPVERLEQPPQNVVFRLRAKCGVCGHVQGLRQNTMELSRLLWCIHCSTRTIHQLALDR